MQTATRRQKSTSGSSSSPAWRAFACRICDCHGLHRPHGGLLVRMTLCLCLASRRPTKDQSAVVSIRSSSVVGRLGRARATLHVGFVSVMACIARMAVDEIRNTPIFMVPVPRNCELRQAGIAGCSNSLAIHQFPAKPWFWTRLIRQQ